jgi:hypothetical protein
VHPEIKKKYMLYHRENMHKINAFSKYFSIIGRGKFFGPFQEYRKNHMSTKCTF